MPSIEEAYRALTLSISAWAAARDDVSTLALIGSRARSEMPADESSDIDLVLVCDDPAALLKDGEWIRRIGRPWFDFAESAPGIGYWERRVLYEGGLDADFILVKNDDLDGR